MNEPPGARLRVGLSGLTVAEYFRDEENADVLVFIDNIFRFTQAGSEVSALLGRMPSAVGYQPTLATEMGELQERITSTRNGSITSVQAIYVPADDITDPAPATAFAHLDATVVLRARSPSSASIPPSIRSLRRREFSMPQFIGERHYKVATAVQRILQRYKRAAGHHRDPRHGRALRGRQARSSAARVACSASCRSRSPSPSSSPASRASTSSSRRRSRRSSASSAGEFDTYPEQAFFMAGGATT